MVKIAPTLPNSPHMIKINPAYMKTRLLAFLKIEYTT
jgi:hypothetical protein